MNNQMLFAFIFFFAGAALTKGVFYFQERSARKKFFSHISLYLLSILETVYVCRRTLVLENIDRIKEQNLKSEEEIEQYLNTERGISEAQMELFVYYVLSSMPKKDLKYISFSDWRSAKNIIQKLRTLYKNQTKK